MVKDPITAMVQIRFRNNGYNKQRQQQKRLHRTRSPDKNQAPGPGSPTLPLLPAHGHQPIEQLLPQPDRRHLVTLPIPIDDLQPIRHRLARRPTDDDLRLPAQPAHLFQLFDVRDRH